MINKIQLAWLYFACSPLFSMEVKSDSSPGCAEPTEKSVQKYTMAIDLDPAFFTEAMNYQKALSIRNTNAFFRKIPSTEAYNLEPKQHFSA